MPKKNFVLISIIFLIACLAAGIVLPLVRNLEAKLATALEEAEAAGKYIPRDELENSRAAQFFKDEQFEEALAEFEKLHAQYPEDVLILRYIGICLYRLNRFQEAVTKFQEGLDLDPYNIATRYFLGYAYYRIGELDHAEREFNYVATYDIDGHYAGKTAYLLESLVAEKKRAAKAAPAAKRLRFYGLIGYEYDTNVTLESNVPDFQTPADQNASRFLISTSISYDPIVTKIWRTRAQYEFSQTLHDDSLDEFNFTRNRGSIRNSYFTELAKIPTTFNVEYSFEAGFLDGSLFSVSNSLESGVSFRFTPTSRTEAINTYSYIDFGPDGIRREINSRDGHYNETSITHTIFFPKSQRSIYGTYVFETAATAGDNFDYTAHTVRTGFRSPIPLFEKFDMGLVGVYRHSDYFNFHGVDRRQGNDWTLVVSCGRNLGRYFRIDAYYRMINANNRNDIYQYDRNIFGVTLSYFY